MVASKAKRYRDRRAPPADGRFTFTVPSQPSLVKEQQWSVASVHRLKVMPCPRFTAHVDFERQAQLSSAL